MHKYIFHADWATFSVTGISSLHNLQEWALAILHFEAGPYAGFPLLECDRKSTWSQHEGDPSHLSSLHFILSYGDLLDCFIRIFY
jgi:hypothetical protein